MDEPALVQLTRVVRAAGQPPAEADDVSPSAHPREEMPELSLGHEDRRRSRARVRLSDGREASVRLARGTILRAGDRLVSADDTIAVRIVAAGETLSLARTSDPHLLARAAYHLGNRHVPLEVRPGVLSYPHDHVLDDLVAALGLTVTCELAPFEPEAGGYRHLGAEGSTHSHGRQQERQERQEPMEPRHTHHHHQEGDG